MHQFMILNDWYILTAIKFNESLFHCIVYYIPWKLWRHEKLFCLQIPLKILKMKQYNLQGNITLGQIEVTEIQNGLQQ